MNLCISSLAWDNKDRLAVYQLLQKNHVPFLEIVLSKLSPDFFNKPVEFYMEKKQEWEQYDLKAVSIQSIHFGVENAFLFGTKEQRNNLLDATKKVIDIAHVLEISNLVFGSPKLRIIPENNDTTPSIDFFATLNEYAKSNNCIINLEANSAQYGTNFLTNTEQVKNFVYSQHWSNVGINLDLGTLILENENIPQVLKDIHKVFHAHISIPFLKTNFIDFKTQIQEYITAFQKAVLPGPTTGPIRSNVDTLSIEMVSQETDLALIQDTIQLVKEFL